MTAPADHAHDGSPATWLEYGDSIRRRYAGRRIITDDNMGAEWR